MPHEKSITIRAQTGKGAKRFVLIPTVVGGKTVSPRAASRHFEKTGKNFGRFKTIAEARGAAIKRSQSSGTHPNKRRKRRPRK